MSDIENLILALACLWLGVVVCFVMKWFHYFISADLGMALILICFTALAIYHNHPPQLGNVAAASAPSSSAPLLAPAGSYVTRPGDGFYHTPDCERLRGDATQPYHSGTRAPCIDCILPQRQRLATSR